MKFFAILLSWLVASTASAAIYKKVEAGRIILSDQPIEGGVLIEERPISTVPGLEQGKQGTKPTAGKVRADGSYQIMMASPAEGKVYLADETIPVSLTVEPSLKSGHKLVMLLDGSILKDRDSLKGLPVGAHRVEAMVQDAAGKVIGSSYRAAFQVVPALPQGVGAGKDVR